MRQLLQRWSELEPGRCRHKLPGTPLEGFILNFNDCWNLIHSKKVDEPEALMRIQWAVQAAIVSRGWWLSLDYKGDWCCILYYWHNERTVENARNITLIGQKSSAEALLSAYLKALESEVTR